MLVGAVYGGMVLAIYPIGVAHTNDFLPPEDAIAATGGLLLAFGIGAMLGPIAAAWLMDTGGRNALFYYSPAGAQLPAGFTFSRIRVRAPAAVEVKTGHVLLSPLPPRSEAGRVGAECGSTWCSAGSPAP